MFKKLAKLAIPASVALLALWYSQLDESKKRYLKHLGRQAPYLPARYYA